MRAEADSIALSVIIPTRNEEASVRPLMARLDAVLANLPSEVIFVDDSDDGTPGIIDDLVDAHRFVGSELSLVHRPPGEREGGLGGAVVARAPESLAARGSASWTPISNTRPS